MATRWLSGILFLLLQFTLVVSLALKSDNEERQLWKPELRHLSGPSEFLTASVISSKYTNEENLATLLSNTTTEKRSIPELTPLACWTAKLLLGADAEYSSANESLIEVNSIDFNGILISTTNLDALTVSSDNSIASIGPGLRGGAVYEALDPYGVSVIGGRIPQVGVGGLILGGGLSHFSAQHGLAADNIKNFEVVLASGEIVNANAKKNSDLFWALKRGGPNFGIVTRFDMYTIPIRNIWFQATAYSLTELPNILAAFTEWQKNGAQTDPKTSVLINILNTGCSLGLVYSEPATYPDAFAPFAAIPNGIVRVPATNATVSLLSTILGSAFQHCFCARLTELLRHVYHSAASLIDETLYNETSSYYFDTINGLQADGVNFNMTFNLQTISPSLVAASEARGAPSYADQNPLAQYPPENIKAMKGIAAKYGPSRVFQLLQKGGFLLSKV
ncbi:hypothetical protein BCON_0002g01180 [Botryotinia convoluta]|uniref:FAD-binding PCMH-type domain-containing protein n=1 Tax=Botryotinia convoluta TaxID=54673 RepID=A0A4Z1J1M7_9HELO|nr:hypothetical protein BCON_0002g01180 [Botryotinia convoluta]